MNAASYSMCASLADVEIENANNTHSK